MKDVVEKLTQFSNQFDLWSRALFSGKQAICKYFQEYSKEAERILPQQTLESLQFENKNQKLTFIKTDEACFILSTTLSLFSSADSQRKVEIGYYTLDVDQNGDAKDDWLVFY